jgi:hypothetical protein
VVESGCRIQNDERGPENAAAHDMPDVSMHPGESRQNTQADYRQNDPHTVRDTVGDLLTDPTSRFHFACAPVCTPKQFPHFLLY